VTPHSAGIKAALSKSPPLGAGSISFPSMSLAQALNIYSAISGRKLDPSSVMPPVLISLTTQNSLTKEEACYALETVFRLNGIKLVPSSDGMVKAVPLSVK
jgi:hypothetical protein